MLPSSCVNGCGLSEYRANLNISTFLCVPYRSVKVAGTKLSQIYLNGYADVGDFELYSGLSSITSQL